MVSEPPIGEFSSRFLPVGTENANPESKTETCLNRLINSKRIIKTESPGMPRLQLGSPDNGSMAVRFVPDKSPIVLPVLIRPDRG